MRASLLNRCRDHCRSAGGSGGAAGVGSVWVGIDCYARAGQGGSVGE